MDIFVLDKNLSTVGILNNYNSFIWTERYAEAGDFQLELPASMYNVDLLKQDRYLKISDSNETMIIENISIKTENNSQHMTVTGRSLISILDRRVVLGARYFNDDKNSDPENNVNLWKIAKTLVDENAVAPETNKLLNAEEYLKEYNNLLLGDNNVDNRRKITILQTPQDNYYIDNTDLDPYKKIVEKKPLNLQFNGESLYDAVKSLCDKYHLGFSISDYSTIPGISSEIPFVFYLYDGRDLSDSIILSPTFDNIANISYANNKDKYKNIMLAIGDELNNGGVNFQAWAIVDTEGFAMNNHTKEEYPDVIDRIPKSLELRENIQNISSEVTHDGNTAAGEPYDLNDKQYYEALVLRAYEMLKDQNEALEAFDGELVNNGLIYKIKEDYDLGDIILMSDNLGHSKKMRVTEVIYSHNSSGYKIYPTLALYEKDEYQQRDET